jgi:serine/threonine protein kinase
MPPGIDRILARALEVDPDNRYQTARELQNALVAVARDACVLCSAPDLAVHLREVCGEPSTWIVKRERSHGR